MSKPKIVNELNVYEAVSEIQSARSSLHMQDSLLENPPNKDDIQFIDEKYEYAKHAAEHLQAAFANLILSYKQHTALREIIIKIHSKPDLDSILIRLFERDILDVFGIRV
jgi:hypothetical protein